MVFISATWHVLNGNSCRRSIDLVYMDRNRQQFIIAPRTSPFPSISPNASVLSFSGFLLIFFAHFLLFLVLFFNLPCQCHLESEKNK